MFETSNNYQQTQDETANGSPIAGKRKNEARQSPTGILPVNGYPECESAYWIAPPGSGNAGSVFGSVYRCSIDSSGKKRTYRTFPFANGGLVANVIGSVQLMDWVAQQPSVLTENERNLYFQISLDVSEAVSKNLSPREAHKHLPQTFRPTAGGGLVQVVKPGF